MAADNTEKDKKDNSFMMKLATLIVDKRKGFYLSESIRSSPLLVSVVSGRYVVRSLFTLTLFMDNTQNMHKTIKIR